MLTAHPSHHRGEGHAAILYEKLDRFKSATLVKYEVDSSVESESATLVKSEADSWIGSESATLVKSEAAWKTGCP